MLVNAYLMECLLFGAVNDRLPFPDSEMREMMRGQTVVEKARLEEVAE